MNVMRIITYATEAGFRAGEKYIARLKGFFFLYFYFCFLGPHLRHMEAPRLGAEQELQLMPQLIAMPDP